MKYNYVTKGQLPRSLSHKYIPRADLGVEPISMAPGPFVGKHWKHFKRKTLNKKTIFEQRCASFSLPPLPPFHHPVKFRDLGFGPVPYQTFCICPGLLKCLATCSQQVQYLVQWLRVLARQLELRPMISVPGVKLYPQLPTLFQKCIAHFLSVSLCLCLSLSLSLTHTHTRIPQ